MQASKWDESEKLKLVKPRIFATKGQIRLALDNAAPLTIEKERGVRVSRGRRAWNT